MKSRPTLILRRTRVLAEADTRGDDSSPYSALTHSLDARAFSDHLRYARQNPTTQRTEAEGTLALLNIDTIARGGLSRPSFARYEAYKRALMLEDEDIESVVSTLSLFEWDLMEGRSGRVVH